MTSEHKLTRRGALRLAAGSLLGGRVYAAAFQLATFTAVREALRTPKKVTHFGIGQAQVDRVASNRRAELPDGRVNFHRASTTKDPIIRNAPEGLIDPYLKTLSFWDGSHPVAALSC